MIEDILLLVVPVIFLYAETHYRFKYFLSWLRKKEPEIIADIPSRIEVGQQIPILIIIKDADKYPVTIQKISIFSESTLFDTIEVNKIIRESYDEIIIERNTGNLAPGLNQLHISIYYQINSVNKICYNDNHRGTSHDPLPIFISQSTIPRLNQAVIGETHAHTYYTSDQVEFGASVNTTAKMAQSMGFDFYCATDHSYDLDDLPDNYLINDPNLVKWHAFQNEVSKYNEANQDFKIIPGEEVTLRNNRGKNVHCLVYNSQKFFPGSGDGAEKWFHMKSELSIPELIEQTDENVFIFAAHPFEKPPFLQQLFIGRDTWRKADCIETGIHGLQFINGGTQEQSDYAIGRWIAYLLQGYHIIGLAGNDAHGNFSRFRQIGLPFVTMREHYYHLFGRWFTGVFIQSKTICTLEILKAMSAGACYMSNGPAICMRSQDQNANWINTGQYLKKINKVKIEVKSNSDFGDLKSVKVYVGNLQKKCEELIHQKSYANNEFESREEISFKHKSEMGYIRAEVYTTTGHQALTNPIWMGDVKETKIHSGRVAK